MYPNDRYGWVFMYPLFFKIVLLSTKSCGTLVCDTWAQIGYLESNGLDDLILKIIVNIKIFKNIFGIKRFSLANLIDIF